jgi:outer membrane lipoprotein-sorting protein
MVIQRTRGPAARGYARLWDFALAAGILILGGCSLPRATDSIPAAPITTVAGAKTAPPIAFQGDVETVLENMKVAYDKVKDYQTEVGITFFEKDGSSRTETTLYTFKKPKWIRLDFVSPRPGLIMIYPDRNNKVFIKPRGLLSILGFHRPLDDPLLKSPTGQRINQTDLGLLIKNIRHGVTDQRRGPVSILEDDNTIQIEVLADDHFLEGVETRYQFLISKELWLPVEVSASKENGVQEWRIVFRNLRTNINVPDALFQ